MNDVMFGAKLIRDGELVAFPTETVYGLGANALDDIACQKIYKMKGRPQDNPLIVHVNSLTEAKNYAIFNEDAEKLAILWPGPLTMVLPRRAECDIAKTVSAGLPTIAIRISANKICRELIATSGFPIAAPSANKSGYLSPTRSQHVKKSFGEELYIIESEESHCYGLESTIIDLTVGLPIILRFGYITPENIEDILGKRVGVSMKNDKVKAPGMSYKHYSPNLPLRINVNNMRANEVGINFGDHIIDANGLNLSFSGDLVEAASNLFDYLHRQDIEALSRGKSGIAITPIPKKGIGLAINDRLERATDIKG